MTNLKAPEPSTFIVVLSRAKSPKIHECIVNIIATTSRATALCQLEFPHSRAGCEPMRFTFAWKARQRSKHFLHVFHQRYESTRLLHRICQALQSSICPQYRAASALLCRSIPNRSLHLKFFIIALTPIVLNIVVPCERVITWYSERISWRGCCSSLGNRHVPVWFRTSHLMSRTWIRSLLLLATKPDATSGFCSGCHVFNRFRETGRLR